MTLTIDLPEELAQRLLTAASKAGKDQGTYTALLIQKALDEQKKRNTPPAASLADRFAAYIGAVAGTPRKDGIPWSHIEPERRS